MKGKNNNMDIVTNSIVTGISKPGVGIGAGGVSGLALVLKWCGVISILAGTIGTVVGAIIACLHLYFFIKNRQWEKK
jgi:hypothetical protein